MAKNCPTLIANGTCDNAACTYNHNILFCEPCRILAANSFVLQAHLQGKKHRNKVAGLSTIHYCPVCAKNIHSRDWAPHVSGAPHQRNAESQGITSIIEPEEGITANGQQYCNTCGITVMNAHWNNHKSSSTHQMKIRFASFRSVLDEAERDKNGVVLDGSGDLDIVEVPAAQHGVQLTMTIRSTNPSLKVVLAEVKLASSQGGRVVTSPFSFTIQGENRRVISGNQIKVAFVFRQSRIGRYEERVEFIFQDTQLQKRFIISRTLKAIVGNKADHEALRPVIPYVARKRGNRQREDKVVEGVAPPSLKAIPYVGKLPMAPVPLPLMNLLRGPGRVEEKIDDVKTMFIPRQLNVETYGRHFKHLLWIEEIKMENDLERYDILNTTLTKHAPYFYLEVPGLAEKRPSVLVGDIILVQKDDAPTGHWFAGGVHVVRQAEVGLRFSGSFAGWSATQKYNVRFKLNRIPLRREHQAMDTVFTQERVLFPTSTHFPSALLRPRDASIKIFNPLLSTNQPQLQAVVSIVNQVPGSCPFVIFGPPGTGKTITIIESIRQILHANPRAKVLACAPSNSAADLIASRLVDGGLTSDQLFRFYAPSRFKNQVPDHLLSFTHTRPDGHFSVPPVAKMKAFRVVVTTCVSASVISGIGIPRGHYSHIIIDEAGQATEPESFVSIKTMADNATNIVLSGDPKQLGPIIRSPIARELGLETSYLERLMDRVTYDIEVGHGRTVVKLTKNFRSHNAILEFPNARFYNGDLEPCADRKTINYYLKSGYLPSSGKQFPIVFHAVSGKDDREASSPSFFNIEEALQVKSYIERLRADRKFRTTDSDIGVICPYHAQGMKIRTLLRPFAAGVKVGSVEEFQGQERPVIIISTVRSSKEYVEYDLRHTLGFVANPRRFNVAVTRAKALLIIIGDPQVLSLDPLWRSFLNYIYRNNGWEDPSAITWDPAVPVDEDGGYDREIREAAQIDMNQLSRRMETLTMEGVDDELDANVDRPWRDVE